MELQEALFYASAGWPVFPCSPNTKRPLLQGAGFKDAKTDRSWIGGIWGKHPRAMIAVPTGKPIGHFVLDLDPDANPEHKTAAALLAAVEAAIGVSLPQSTMRVNTPRGGLHLYFQQPEGVEIRNRAGVILPGVDVRGTGGYVVVPYSMRRGPKAVEDGCDGVAYTWIGNRPAALNGPPAPAELIEAVRPRDDLPEDTRPISERAAPRPPADASDPLALFAAAALDGEIEKVRNAAKGQRNAALNNAALALGAIAAHGLLDFGTCEPLLLQAADGSGLLKSDGVKQCRATIASGWRAGLAAPRDLRHVGTKVRSIGGAPPIPPLDGLDSYAREPHGAPRAARGEGGGGKSGGGGEASGPDPEKLAANAREPLNDIGNARRLLRWHGDDMLIVKGIGPHIWTGTHWTPDGAPEAFQRHAQQTSELIADEAWHLVLSKSDAETMAKAKELEALAEEDLDGEQRATMAMAEKIRAGMNKQRGGRRKFAISSGNSSKIAGMQNQAYPLITCEPSAMDVDAMAINVKNGTLRIDGPTWDADSDGKRATYALRLDAHDRKDRIAKIAATEYQPGAKCPRWSTFIERFQPNPEIRRFLQQWSGVSLTGRPMQHFVFHYGLGANGKSTAMETWARIAGSYATSLPAEAITGDLQRRGDQATPEFTRLVGARLVRCAELPRGQGIKESVLKMLTGGEAMPVRNLHQPFFDLHPICKAQGSGNDRPPIGGVDEGIWRRMKLVPWNVQIPEGERRDMDEVMAEFMAEGPGILNWMLAGLVDYLESGFFVPAEIRAATDDYRDDMDPIGSFLRACSEPKAGEKVTAREMFKGYEAWCNANSVRRFAETTFAKIMTQKGVKKTNGRIREYLDIVLHDVPNDPDAKGGGGQADAFAPYDDER